MQKLIVLSLTIQTLVQSFDMLNRTIILDTIPPTITPEKLQQYLSTSADGDKYFSTELNQDQLPTNVSEYGYGFWFRFLTTYPTRLLEGKIAPEYFLSRLTINKDFGDIAFGDRLLAIWQGQGSYHFASCNTVGHVADVDADINYPIDIEGIWTYVYYSHSQVLKRAVGFMQFGTEPSKRIQLDVTHPDIQYLKLIIGGKQLIYPGFNGQIYSIEFIVDGHNTGAFINDDIGFQDDKGDLPNFDLNYFLQFNQVNQTQDILADQGNQIYKLIDPGTDAFPREYSVSGWFKWTGPFTSDFHMLFRLTIYDINDNTDDSTLGDRSLAVFLNKNDFYRCSTYTYTNMNGDGNPDYYQDEQNQGQIFEWNFIYFGYSKNMSKAYFYYENPQNQNYQDLNNTNHYLVDKFYFLLRDSRYPYFNGQEAFININLGSGAYLESLSDYSTKGDIFQYQLGSNILVPNLTSSIQTSKVL